MKKADLVMTVHAITGGTKVQAEDIVNSMFDAMKAALMNGDEVDIAGFCKLLVKPRPARTARNPLTGASVSVPATKVVKFRVAKQLKDAVAGKK